LLPSARTLPALVFRAGALPAPVTSYRTLAPILFIADQDCADVAILTEVGTGPDGQALTDSLGEGGYSVAPGHAPPASGFRAVLASRGLGLAPVPPGIDVLPNRGSAAAVSFDDHVIGLLGPYVPWRGPQRWRNEDRRACQAAVTRALPRLLASPDRI